ESLERLKDVGAIILDFSHPIILYEQEKLRQILEYLHRCVPNIMLIDGLEEHALIKRMSDIPVDFVVAPYVGAVKQDGPWRFLAGPSYAVLSGAYAGLETRIIRLQTDRVLISCGGSDPKKITLTLLKGIEKITKTLQVRVIIGPLFNENLKETIKKVVKNSKHFITLVDSPHGLLSHMLWCDLAIAASGLIKYELAATSTPAILVSIDEFHHLMNQPFSKIGSTVDLGARVKPQMITEHVKNLLDNHTMRLAMATAGRQAIDGKGAERLISEITRSCCVAQ
ncbi:MAG: hypothetical protein EPN84_00640, partial [Legionella sp.]